jgi:hypothetical protein
VAPVKNMEEVFFLHPVMNKNLSRFFKICLRFPEIHFERRGVKQTKMGGFEKLGEGGFGEISGMSDPP